MATRHASSRGPPVPGDACGPRGRSTSPTTSWWCRARCRWKRSTSAWASAAIADACSTACMPCPTASSPRPRRPGKAPSASNSRPMEPPRRAAAPPTERTPLSWRHRVDEPEDGHLEPAHRARPAPGLACILLRLWHAHHFPPVQGPAWLRAGVAAYVELVRNTPFIIQLFFVFFGLPSLGLRLSPEVASALAMVLNLGAYASEIARAGIEATPQGQIEAALSLAMNRWQIFTRVVLPPALARVWPALVSQMIIVMLGSSVCGQISTEEFSFAANLIASRTFRNFEAYILVTLAYLALAVALRRLLNWFGPRFIFGR